MRFLITLLIATFMLASCMSYGTKVDQEQVSRLVKGKTTYNEAIQQLGKPTNSTVNANGTRILTYSYLQHQMNPASFIPIVGLFARGGQTENTTVILNFDKNSILTDYSASESGSSMGTGLLSGQKQ